MDDDDGDDDGFPMEPPTTRRRLSEDAEDDRPGLDLPATRSGSTPSALDFADPPAAPGAIDIHDSPRSRSNRAPSRAPSAGYTPTSPADEPPPIMETDEDEPALNLHILVLCRAAHKLDNLLHCNKMCNLLHCHNLDNLHFNLNNNHLLHYHLNLIQCNLMQLQLERAQPVDKSHNLILRWHLFMNQLAPMIDFDYNANGLTAKKLRSLDPSDDGEIINHNPMTGMELLAMEPMDYWEVKAGCVIRHHQRPRRSLFRIKDFTDMPLDPELLDGHRTTVLWKADGTLDIISDSGTDAKHLDTEWTGCTIYQITGRARREMGMFANLPAKKMGREAKTKMARQQKKVDKGGVNERHLSAADRAKFQEAKRKELESFFHNGVWEFNTTADATPERTLTARVLTKWTKHADGSPRAKARLIVRGYQDFDALTTGLETSSPTTSRTSRSFLLSLASLLGWTVWTSDIATAFLQGGNQKRRLWVKLPSDCLQLLGASPDTRMLLLKPVYGQLDAPRMWWQEAQRRLRELGLRQHPLDPCLFLVFEVDFAEEPCEDNSVFGTGRLCGAICLHVDDMLGAGSPTSKTYAKLVESLRASFNFREWKDGNRLEYCGSVLEKLPEGGIKLCQETYLGKVHPVPTQKGTGPNTDLTSKEITQLRGLCGALQWPAVQSSPHLQATTSITSGMINNGKVSTITELNSGLKFAKQNADVGLIYKPLGEISKLRLVTMFDASFSVRADGSSQGGYMVMLVPEHTLTNTEDWFHMLEWRSLKLPRVARSSLAAETQAAACAADATDFICKFWSYFENPNRKLSDLLGQESSLRPVMITDAKALYDSYHRESVTSSVTDRRIALEIRVIKELIQELKGELKWVSSERQWADGLTKISARQLLASRLRHGKIGFYWDPCYTAAKKKTAAERQQNMDQHADPPPKRLRVIDEDVMDEEIEDQGRNYDTEDDGMPVEAYAYMVYTDDMLEYENVVLPKSEDIAENSEAILTWMREYMSTTMDVMSNFNGILPSGLSLLAYTFTGKMILGLLLLVAVVYIILKYVD
eukprot:s1452_g2.t1